MKKRHGFVSNSSSSSFIVTGSKNDGMEYITTAQAAYDAILMLIDDAKEEEEYGKYPQHLQLEAAKKWLEMNETFDGPIYIPWTCNYETFIFKVGDMICVETCNNHIWDEVYYLYDRTDARAQFERAITAKIFTEEEVNHRWEADDMDQSDLVKNHFFNLGSLSHPKKWRFHNED